MYTKEDFGRELTEEINKNFDLDRLSNWAHKKYLDECTLDKETDDVVMTVMFLSEEGFEMSKEELLKLAADLQKNI